MSTFRKSAGLAAAIVLTLSVSACSSDTDTAAEPAAPAPSTSSAVVPTTPAAPSGSATGSVGVANAAFCASTAVLRTEVEELKTLAASDSTTTAALEAQKQEVATAGDQARAEADSLERAMQVQVGAAITAYQKAIDAIPADTAGLKEVAAYTAANFAFGKALDAIDNQVGCP